MSDTKNFRINLNLSNFFHDHRAMCRIFIKKKMKCISDLQDHISNIFNLKDFYLISQSHYIPPTEDIRILQQDDNLFAIPNVSSSTAIYTSTPKIPQSARSPIKKKRKRVVDEEQEDNLCIVDDQKQKRKKKAKRDTNNVEQEDNLSIVYDQKQKKKKKAKRDIKKKECGYEEKDETEQLQENCILDVNMKNDDTKTIKRTKKQNIQADEIMNMEECTDKSCFVKEKVLYFENHLSLDASMDASKKASDDGCHDNTTNIEHPVKYKEQNDQGKLDNSSMNTYNSETHEDNLNEFRHKKLFVQKRNKNIIDFNLPKQSNLVKSILVPSESKYIETSCIEKKSIDKHENCTTYKETKIHKIESLICKEKLQCNESKNNSLHIQPVILSNEKVQCDEFKNTSLQSSEKVNFKSTKDTDGIQCDTEEIIMTSSFITKNTHEHAKQFSEDINKNVHDADEKAILVKEIVSMNTTENVVPTNSRCTESDLDIVSNINTSKVDSCVNKQSGLDIFSKGNTSEGDSWVNVSSEQEPSLHELSSSSATMFLDNSDNPNFITKRKRKRTRRKHKSKSVDILPPPAPIHYEWNRRPHTVPTIHIKFNEDGEAISDEDMKQNSNELTDALRNNTNTEPIRNSEDNIKHTSLECFDLCKNITNGSEDTKNETQSFQVETVLQEEGSVKQNNIVNNINGKTDQFSCSNNYLISEDIILKSPLMTSTKPKVGDLIAFKILRLSKDYTPEISKHLIGEILSVNGTFKLDVNINIIDGADQCVEPEGKFAIESDNKEQKNVKSFCWLNLISPRLLYP